jgi:hypothetical protein
MLIMLALTKKEIELGRENDKLIHLENKINDNSKAIMILYFLPLIYVISKWSYNFVNQQYKIYKRGKAIVKKENDNIV